MSGVIDKLRTLGHDVSGAGSTKSARSPLLLNMQQALSPALVVVIGLGVFGFVFAVISSLHSYLILAYAGSKKAAEDVGFYYAANAAGRLFGILMSGLLTQYGGLAACLWGLGGNARPLPRPDVVATHGL
jgi:hypothetical protein